MSDPGKVLSNVALAPITAPLFAAEAAGIGAAGKARRKITSPLSKPINTGITNTVGALGIGGEASAAPPIPENPIGATATAKKDVRKKGRAATVTRDRSGLDVSAPEAFPFILR